ncbi:hypothetical protein LTR17_026647, partial [Elasticomyces elasticus]
RNRPARDDSVGAPGPARRRLGHVPRHEDPASDPENGYNGDPDERLQRRPRNKGKERAAPARADSPLVMSQQQLEQIAGNIAATIT